MNLRKILTLIVLAMGLAVAPPFRTSSRNDLRKCRIKRSLIGLNGCIDPAQRGAHALPAIGHQRPAGFPPAPLEIATWDVAPLAQIMIKAIIADFTDDGLLRRPSFSRFLLF